LIYLFPFLHLSVPSLHSFFCFILSTLDSSVGIELGYGLDDRGSRVRFPMGAGNSSLHHRVQNGSGTHPASIQWVPGALYLGVKRLGREADHLLASCTEVKNALSYTSTPQYVFMAWCLVKHRDNFPLLLPFSSSLYISVPLSLIAWWLRVLLLHVTCPQCLWHYSCVCLYKKQVVPISIFCLQRNRRFLFVTSVTKKSEINHAIGIYHAFTVKSIHKSKF
jgi:hypothetical protein